MKAILLFDLENDDGIYFLKGTKYELEEDTQGKYIKNFYGNKLYLTEFDINNKLYILS